MDFYIYLQKTIFPSILFLLIPLQLCDISSFFFPLPFFLICQSRGRKNLKKKKRLALHPEALRRTILGGGWFWECKHACNCWQAAIHWRVQQKPEKVFVTDSFHFLEGMTGTARQMWEQVFTQESSKETKHRAWNRSSFLGWGVQEQRSTRKRNIWGQVWLSFCQHFGRQKRDSGQGSYENQKIT